MYKSKLGQVIALQVFAALTCLLFAADPTTVDFDKKDQTQFSYTLLRFWKQIDNTI